MCEGLQGKAHSTNLAHYYHLENLLLDPYVTLSYDFTEYDSPLARLSEVTPWRGAD